MKALTNVEKIKEAIQTEIKGNENNELNRKWTGLFPSGDKPMDVRSSRTRHKINVAKKTGNTNLGNYALIVAASG